MCVYVTLWVYVYTRMCVCTHVPSVTSVIVIVIVIIIIIIIIIIISSSIVIDIVIVIVIANTYVLRLLLNDSGVPTAADVGSGFLLQRVHVCTLYVYYVYNVYVCMYRYVHVCVYIRRIGRMSGGWKCAIVGVPWRGSVSAFLAWGYMFVETMFIKVPKRLSLLRHRGTPMMAHLQLPEYGLQDSSKRGAVETWCSGAD